MKNMKRFPLFLALLALAPSAASQANTVTASSVKITGYEFWASTSTDCSNPIKVIDNGAAGKEIDTAQSTDFGSGTLPPDGTYNCIIVVVSDTMTVVPAVTGTTMGTNNNCAAGTTYTQDTCTTGTSLLPDGTTTTCSATTNQKVAAYMSTTGTDGADGHLVSTAKKLNAAIVIANANVEKTLYVNSPSGLSNQNGSCGQGADTVLGIR